MDQYVSFTKKNTRETTSSLKGVINMPGKETKHQEGDGDRRWRAGDQIHITVTREFTETAGEFLDFCRANNFNISGVIRECMESWLKRQKRIQQEFAKTEQ